jgi:uncharacterized protein YabE (DUF348 family)/3D (Asp-Asp-Asp) domain-containing protein
MTIIRRRLAALFRTELRALGSRSVWVILLALALAGTVYGVSNQTKLVYIHDNGVLTSCYTMRRTAQGILEENGIETGSYDEVRFDGFEDKIGVIEVKRAFPVTVTVDGVRREVMTTATPVAELLEENGVELGEFDIITPSTDSLLMEESDIVIQRVELSTTVVTEEVSYETEYKLSSLLRTGRTRTIVAGETGERVLTYVDRIVDGELQERELINTVTTKEAVTAQVLVGSNDAVSPLDFGIELDANGIPTSYRTVLTDQICTGYSSKRTNPHGASGLSLSAGYVAVRADQIPYGTRLYITSADNSFVYGFAIAADTGVALVNHTIDLDLFYDTYEESLINGRKICNVYILD